MTARPFVSDAGEPAYLAPAIRGLLPERVRQAQSELRCCRACPRACAADRTAGQLGYCGVGRRARVASAFAHFGEEDCLRGAHGSGTIFFSGCNLHCVFCQNWDISQQPAGQEVESDRLAELMLALQAERCHNLNLVTPEHVVPQIIEALALAIEGGLRIPIVYNTSAYDALPSLALLDGLVDIYMPDFKFWRSETAAHLSRAVDYPERARAAVREMHRQVGVLRFTPDGLATRGVLVRHLVMPGLVDEAREIVGWLARELSPNTFVNIMGQYHPDNEVIQPRTASAQPRTASVRPHGAAGRPRSASVPQPADTEAGRAAPGFAEIARRPTSSELAAAYAAAREAGLWRFDERA